MRTAMGGAGATAYRAELVPDSLSLGDKKKYHVQAALIPSTFIHHPLKSF